jgi:hypothetical protein
VNEAEYLNVDLELDSEADLSALAGHLGGRVFVLFNDRVGDIFRLSLEMSCAEEPASPTRDLTLDADECIRDFLSLITQLPPRFRAIWDSCISRVFDIGIVAGTPPSVCIQTVSENTLQAVSAVRGTIRVTVYPAQLENTRNG